MVFEDLINERFDVDFDVVASLEHLDAVVHVQISLSLDWDLDFIFDNVHQDFGGKFVRCCDSEIVNLPHEEDPAAVDDS